MRGTDALDLFFEELARVTDAVPVNAPSRLKARTYSALVRVAHREAPLCTLDESKAFGRGLCVFEELVRIVPAGEQPQRLNWCHVCHARLLAEYFENAPIFWPNCPYVRFQNR
jgi:hypothetical protein